MSGGGGGGGVYISICDGGADVLCGMFGAQIKSYALIRSLLTH